LEMRLWILALAISQPDEDDGDYGGSDGGEVAFSLGVQLTGDQIDLSIVKQFV